MKTIKVVKDDVIVLYVFLYLYTIYFVHFSLYLYKFPLKLVLEINQVNFK